jgi:hypothetical protein
LHPSTQLTELRAALRELAGSRGEASAQERGGVIVTHDSRVEFRELPNFSAFGKRFVTAVSRSQTRDRPPLGFWHTHAGSALPSPADVIEILRLNRRFGAAFFLCILGARSISIARFNGWRRPVWLYEPLPADMADPALRSARDKLERVEGRPRKTDNG